MNGDVRHFETAVQEACRHLRRRPASLRALEASAFATAAYCEIIASCGPRVAAQFFYEMADAAAAIDARAAEDFRFKLPGTRQSRWRRWLDLALWTQIWLGGCASGGSPCCLSPGWCEP